MEGQNKSRTDGFPAKPARLPNEVGKYLCYKCKVSKAVVNSREKACKACFLNLVESIFKTSLHKLQKHTNTTQTTDADRYLLCVSGGTNSMCLLHLSHQMAAKHVNWEKETVSGTGNVDNGTVLTETEGQLNRHLSGPAQCDAYCKKSQGKKPSFNGKSVTNADVSMLTRSTSPLASMRSSPCNNTTGKANIDIKNINMRKLQPDELHSNTTTVRKAGNLGANFDDFSLLKSSRECDYQDPSTVQRAAAEHAQKSLKEVLSSTALLNIVGVAHFNSDRVFAGPPQQEGLESENQQGTLEALKKVVNKTYGYPFFDIPLGYSMHVLPTLSQGVVPTMNLKQNSSETLQLYRNSVEAFSLENLIFSQMKKVIHLHPQIGKELLEILRMRDIWSLALLLGCNKILMGDCADALAQAALSSICNGGGINLSTSVGYRDTRRSMSIHETNHGEYLINGASRFPYCEFLRPLKSLSAKELVFYHKFNNLMNFPSSSSTFFTCFNRGLLNDSMKQFLAPSALSHSRKHANTELLVSNFLTQMSSHFAATVTTVNRTCDKIEPLHGDDLGYQGATAPFLDRERCYLCLGWRDMPWEGFNRKLESLESTSPFDTFGEVPSHLKPLHHFVCLSCSRFSDKEDAARLMYSMIQSYPFELF